MSNPGSNIGCRSPKVRAIANASGADRRRAPLPGSAEGWVGDLVLAGRRFEIRARGVNALHRWLGDQFGLILAADREEPLIVLRLGDFLRACRFREREKGPGDVS